MDANRPYRPRVSRETRLLLTTALVAIAALWVLARIRFPDSPATPNPVAPLLSQLATTPTLDGLASEVTQLQARIEPSLVALDRSAAVAAADGGAQTPPLRALRIRDDLAIALLPTVHLRAIGRGRSRGGPRSGLGACRGARRGNSWSAACRLGAKTARPASIPHGDRDAGRTERAAAGLRHRPSSRSKAPCGPTSSGGSPGRRCSWRARSCSRPLESSPAWSSSTAAGRR